MYRDDVQHPPDLFLHFPRAAPLPGEVVAINHRLDELEIGLRHHRPDFAEGVDALELVDRRRQPEV